ncbi:MAG: universal stress protein [bacterium]
MFKSILIPIEGSDFSRAALQFALNVARDQNAQLSLLSIVDKPDIKKSLGPVPLGGMYYALQAEEKKLTTAEQKARRLVDESAEICQKAGVHCELIVREGEPVAVIADEAKYHDLTMLGLRNLFKYGAKEDDKTLENFLSQAEQPIIAVPKTYNSIDNVLMTYDGSLPSARAIHSFIQIGLWNNRHVHLLNVNDNKEHADILLDRMGHLLEVHKIAFDKVHLYGQPNERILGYAVDKKMDLIVLGAHGDAKISRLFFGSTTREILDNVELPLFIDH